MHGESSEDPEHTMRFKIEFPPSGRPDPQPRILGKRASLRVANYVRTDLIHRCTLWASSSFFHTVHPQMNCIHENSTEFLRKARLIWQVWLRRVSSYILYSDTKERVSRRYGKPDCDACSTTRCVYNRVPRDQ
uniref:Uncharacterized protein n=1 Tax=Trichogramma kaykai TaxID=54128 RepID=A0ABD2WKD3_9HYME